jgi:hypothetical protein
MRAAVELVLDLLDSEDTVVFLRRQAATLVDALRRPEDGGALRAAVAAHDDCHATWVALIAAAQRRGHDAADALTDLYTVHGRLLESLERGLDGWFHAGAALEVRRVLADRLELRTLGVIATLPAAMHAR